MKRDFLLVSFFFLTLLTFSSAETGLQEVPFKYRAGVESLVSKLIEHEENIFSDLLKHSFKQGQIDIIQYNGLNHAFAEKLDRTVSEKHLLIKQFISREIENELPTKDEDKSEEGEQKGNYDNLSHHLIAKLTFLNILYFGGGLLVIGSMTLFMTIAWEAFGGGGLFTISTIYSLLFGMIGLNLWFQGENTQIPGGILCTSSIAMVPLAVYGLQKAFGFWITVANNRIQTTRDSSDKFSDFNYWIRPKWIPMELATAIVGGLYFYYLQFPFLLAPVSFCLWFLSMDLTPIVFRSSSFTWNQRLTVSMYFGLALIIFSRYVEVSFGSIPDHAFWLYLFGLISFYFGIHNMAQHTVPYIATCLALLIFGRVFDRQFFLVFSSFGLIQSHVIHLTSFFQFFKKSNSDINHQVHGLKSAHETSFLTHLFRIITLVLFISQAINGLYSLEFLFFLIGYLWANFLYGFNYSSKNEFFHLFQLVVNIGFIYCLQFAHFPLAENMGDIFLSLGSCVFHAPLLVKYAMNRDSSELKIFSYYRLIFYVIIGCFTPLINSQFLLPVLTLGSIACIYIIFPIHRDRNSKKSQMILIHFAFSLFFILYSNLLKSALLYYVTCCYIISLSLFIIQKNDKISCLIGVLMVTLSPILQSSFLSSIGTFVIYCYLSYLSYVIFKNSILFPIFLTATGLFIIAMGIQYQKNYEIIQEFSAGLTPVFVQSFSNFIDSIIEQRPMIIAALKDGFFTSYYSFIFFVPSFVLKFSLMKQEIMAVFSVFFTMIVILVNYLRSFLTFSDNSPPLIRDAILSNIQLASGFNDHGLVLEIIGKKPADLVVDQVYLSVEGEIWEHLRLIVPDIFLSLARNVFLPLKLCPKMLDPKCFTQGKEEFNMTITLGTEQPRVLHTTIKSQLESLLRKNPPIHIVFEKREGFFSKRKLFSIQVNPDQALTYIKRNKK